MNSAIVSAPHPRLPWAARIAGSLLLLFGLAAAYDYTMSVTVGEPYYRASGMNEFQVDYYTTVPPWATLGWTLSVWGGLLAAVFLLLRRPAAEHFFLVCLTGNVVYDLYIYGFSDGIRAMGVVWFMPLVMTVVSLAMWLYARRLRRRGILSPG